MQPEDVPHMGLDAEIGFRVESIEPDRVTGSFRVTPALFGRDGSLHRGVLSATVGSIASVAAASRVGDMDQVVDVTNSTSYFATVSSGTVSLVAEPVQVTPERQEWIVRAKGDAGDLLAHGVVQLATLRQRDDSRT
ncbi:MAG: PaaI family thioesterase [Actinomycetota bacterium]|jgi:acyl-coenzyme A thioesterase PaaI-like protein|nr:PaaI family thioesterase [Actinomycetota bacterium]